MSEQMKTSEDGVISGRISWAPRSEDCHICDVIKTHQEDDLQEVDTSVRSDGAPLYLDQVESTPCVITLQCAPTPRSVITGLLVVSEARTIEVYSASGDYCGTCRGEPDPNINPEGTTDNRPFYKKHLKLECPTTSCEVKLLSLGGRASVGIAGVHVCVQVLEPREPPLQQVGAGGSIDLQQVQSMMEEMGTTLSPGAQHLMGMVQFQQKSKADTMASFFPLLMGSGVFSGLGSKGASVPSPPTARAPPPSPSPSPSPSPFPFSALAPPPALPTAAQDNASLSEPVATATAGHRPCPTPSAATAALSASSRATLAPPPAAAAGMSQGRLAEVMSALMRAPPGQHCAAAPDLLPLLQSVCCQVAQLRMDDSAAIAAQGKAHAPNGPPEVHVCCSGLEEALERRLQQMEARLKEHMDLRLDSLEQKLDSVLQQVLQPPPQPS